MSDCCECMLRPNHKMTPHSNAEQEEPATELPMTDSRSETDDSGSEMDEEEIKRWYSATYKRGSKPPMKKPLTAAWGLPISDADLAKLKVGLRPRDMDDKWEILIEDPDENGNVSIHITRSWLQEECYILHIVPRSNDEGESARIESITWEGNKGGLQCEAEQAEKEAVMLCRGHLHCEFEALPQYPSSAFWDSKAYKKLDAE
ncbi:uncharacterized protein F4812DRAFT_345096 [Daldinia caldariorum]|uniref:uncharacterized protein n=1 Tax=Daldinia caldariorum TaxID=326644 RepID=UPI002007B698|nr:uncharacterized protein F4812DRAFT_345096 [Daldinia caldariorum]KAI1468750.1 hypothetical protein F4812DRAFT_345096 [Daldinia caldariorum]